MPRLSLPIAAISDWLLEPSSHELFIDDAYLQRECSLCEIFLYIDESTSECVRLAPGRNIRRTARRLISAHSLPVLLVDRLIVDDQVLARNNKLPPSCLHSKPELKHWCFYLDSIGDIFCIGCCFPPDCLCRLVQT